MEEIPLFLLKTYVSSNAQNPLLPSAYLSPKTSVSRFLSLSLLSNSNIQVFQYVPTGGDKAPRLSHLPLHLLLCTD